MRRLPEEILKEILVPLLHVPDEEFSSQGSPFGHTHRNTSSLLLVSKHWMRVATPLLYEVVVIRSTAQAQALAYAIKCNKGFGAFMKKLRMEGGFGRAPAQFITSAPNIRELFVTLDVYSNDNPSGLCSAVSGMDLRRIIINHDDVVTNVQANRLWASLFTSIPRWSNLETLEYHATWMVAISGKHKYLDLVTLLKASPSVKHIVLENVQRRVLPKLASVTSLESISVGSLVSDPLSLVEPDPPIPEIVQIRAKVPFEITPEVLPLASVVADFKPLEGVPEHVAMPIWDAILSFATYSYYVGMSPSDKSVDDPYFGSRASFYRTARHLSLVSKSFREIVRRHLFSTVQVESSAKFAAFCDVINDNGTLASLVRVLKVNYLRYSLGETYDKLMAQLLPKLTGLVYLDVPLIDFEQLKLLGPAVSTNLHGLGVRLPVCKQRGHDTVDLGVFGRLAELRCSFDRSDVSRRAKPSPPTLLIDLPNLTTFATALDDGKEDAFGAFCTVRMPSLTHVQLSGRHPKTPEFLRLNGETLKVLKIFEAPSSALWAWCPHLEDLTVYNDPIHTFKSLAQGQRHSSFSKLCFKLRVLRHNTEKAMLSSTEGFDLVDFSQFPNLREINVGGLMWPNTERDIKRNPTCNGFGLCMKKWGIVVYDESGTPWRERAQIRRGR
ncbi:hypothetical protein BD410DRAFT_737178 [Rickenella mellea]|uniref:Uncharacterized protein n=1 Tax=Rickenella mellea TaxID=50990 RepID=A0A4V3AZP9_9AGAM|nr:hypothetical protein BD410DRAFT_737178 [Rickenella mellea]